MAMSPDFVLKMTKLNGTNYRDWAFNMRLHLESLDLFEHADGSAESPADDAPEAVKKKFISSAKKAWTYICLAVEPEQQIHVRETKTAKEAWDALKAQFARESILLKIKLRQQYFSCKFQSGSNMLQHINHMRSLHDQMREMGISVNDKELAMTLLASLPDEYKPLITALDAVGKDSLTFEKVKGMLLSDVDRIGDEKKYEGAYSVQRDRLNNDKSTHGEGKNEGIIRNNFKEFVTIARKRDTLPETVQNVIKEGISNNMVIKIRDPSIVQRKMKLILIKKL